MPPYSAHGHRSRSPRPWARSRRVTCSATRSAGRSPCSATRSSRHSPRRRANRIRRAFGPGPPRTSACRRRSRSRCSSRTPPPSRSRGCASCSIRSPQNGMTPETPLAQREELMQAFERLGARRARGDQRRFGGSTTTLHYALPDLGTGRNPNWDAMGYPGPQLGPAGRPEAASAPPAQRRRRGDRGRRLRRRLRRRRLA